ncbi:hypothetical protein TBLA_0A02970 [Henningerozyma blattae CBS 6284]|uniref:Small ribosomal subunit protein mS41 n=1 Tax=Henningerozyma blattae (strain ATCC 34711 / CBS 6284 / DSM 70876 / NBRC 10599 / NRRL Y-10934 / UCD 77-7) TaxID=1071380 RepID=I2GVE5_HENB6|nr:hypothetical protein TBLA_0A02970 [Tetrapisispora blattae CBS 6284]CCH58097.1 hypothetical protein TBLA_0A02970 [Tetrapisispora blattae CBS 6284]
MLRIQRCFIHSSIKRIIPKPTEEISNVETFLTKIGRNSLELNKVFNNSWNCMFTSTGKFLKQKGVNVRDRRYLLLQLEKFKRNEPLIEYKRGKKGFFGGERKQKANIAKFRNTDGKK